MPIRNITLQGGDKMFCNLLFHIQVFNNIKNKKNIFFSFLIFFFFSCQTKNSQNENILDNLNNKNSKVVAEKMYDDMSLEERVGQLLILDFRYDDSGNPKNYFNVDSKIKSTMKKYHPAGTIIYNQNIESLEQLYKYIADMKDLAKIPLFVAIDEEGGSVSRISRDTINFIKAPSMNKVGATGNPQNAYKIYDVIGKGLAALGINLDFAPIADVLSNPLNKVVKTRSFSSDPELAARMVVGAIQGLSANGIMSTAKHFPGHGSTLEDSHAEVAVSNSTLAELRKSEFIPFKAAALANIPFIMIGHIAVPSLTGDMTPATVSLQVISLLKSELGYNNLVITDAMSMDGIKGIKKVYREAINAGVDILLCPLSKEEAFKELIDSVNDGSISQERLKSIVVKVLMTKIEYGLYTKKALSLDQVRSVLYDPKYKEVYASIVKNH